jgi:Zn-dependent metalloprotease
MTRRLRLCLLGGLATLLVTTTVPPTVASPATRQDDPASVARRHLSDDGTGAVSLDRDRSGRVRFVGTRAGRGLANPEVAPGDSIASAARSHLDRYGAALGAAPGSKFVRRATNRTVSGVDTVVYTQQVAGIPVIGGDVVLGMAQDHSLRSLASSASASATVQDPAVTSEVAAETARAAVARVTGGSDLVVTNEGRAILDPAVVQVSLPGGPRTEWRFEVGDGRGVRQLVLVDDRTGAVLLRADLIEHSDRVVCDRNNVRGPDSACTTGFARVEGDDPVGSPADVDTAYDLSGVVSDFYAQVAGINLTQLLGVDVAGVKKLASTVRYCTPAGSGDLCPYDNAFWNGQQMFYGDGWAGADDVVGHEMTHGFVDQHSQLFYWGQSGAINESMADIVGEIVDHRHPSPGDSSASWDLGEDSPVGTLRNLQDPPAEGQPDRTGSSLYDSDPAYLDNGGVHSNSGVGNKTAYLISQGGTFNGQTITGIDGSDAGLTKTAKLYVDVIERLSSGADFADLAVQLDQSCEDLLATGSAGFTSANCVAVHKAGLATELASTPVNASQPTDADTSCPSDRVKRVLLDSESGTSAQQQARFSTATGAGIQAFSRATSIWGSNATSGQSSWFVPDQRNAGQSLLYATNPVTLPTGQQSYLSFQGWNVLDYDDTGYYDGGVVEVNIDNQTNHYDATSGWVNGPTHALASGTGNPRGGSRAFAGDSRGWVLSRYDLSQWAGHQVTPRFSLFTDADPTGVDFSLIGWYLDDIEIYTCDPLPPPPPPPAPASAPRSMKVYGGVNAVTITWSPPASNLAQLDHYLVEVESTARVVPATSTSLYVPVVTHYLSGLVPRVAAVSKDGTVVWGPSVTVPHPRPTLKARRAGAKLTFKGRLATGSYLEVPIVDAVIKVQRRTSSGWVNVKSARTGSDGKFVIRIKHRKRAKYRAVSVGRLWLIGHVSAAHRW